MRLPRVRFTVRRMMGGIAVLAAILAGVTVLGVRLYFSIAAAIAIPALCLKAWPHVRRGLLPRMTLMRWFAFAVAVAAGFVAFAAHSRIAEDEEAKGWDERWVNEPSTRSQVDEERHNSSRRAMSWPEWPLPR
jgi:hypothetical protein